MSVAALVINDVRPEIVEIFRDVFQFDGRVTSRTSPDEVTRWDSLQHIALVRTIEHTFGISMSMDEMAELRSAGDIERVLVRYGV
jgi:acyl carrier protein